VFCGYGRKTQAALGFVLLLAWNGAAACQGRGRTAKTRNHMKTVVNHLAAEISATPRVKKTEDLRVTVTLTNESSAPMRLDLRYFTAPSLVLRFERDGAPVPTGPPPVPEDDDGSGRVNLAPGGSVSHTYEGEHIFGITLTPGTYTVRFLYSNDPGRPGEWTGSIECGPASFEVVP
jgi:hypothetical protein